MMVSLVPKKHVYECWDKVVGYLERAAEYTFGRYVAEDIYDCLHTDNYHLWIAFEDGKIYGAVVTNFIEYPNKRVLGMQFCGGEELSRWKTPMLDLLKKWARDTQCDAIESTGRKGWTKIFEDDGCKVQWVTYELPIGE